MRAMAVFVVLMLIAVSFSGCLGIMMSGGSDLERVEGVEVDPSTVHVTLQWEKVDGADAYQILRNGRELAIVQENEYDDITLDRGPEYTYEVCAIKMMGHSSSVTGELSDPVNANLDPLTTNLDGYTQFMEDSSMVIEEVVEDLLDAVDDIRLSQVSDLSVRLTSLCDEYGSMAQRFNLPREEAKDEYMSGLEDLESAADSFKSRVGQGDMGNFKEGRELISSGMQHLERARGMV